MDLFDAPVRKRLPEGGEIFLGTSGYSFPDWRGTFYPERVRKRDHLRYYALRFNSVEINSTYYGILKPGATGRMADSVPEGFTFAVKLHSSMTHACNAGKEEWRAFHEMLSPFIEQGKMGPVLAQFPWSFPLEEGSFKWLESISRNLQGLSAAAEFRHGRWYAKEPLERVVKMGFTPVSVDLPELPGLPETGLLETGGRVYLRLHGRNAGKWWGNTLERYDYLYTERDLKGWAKKIRRLSAGRRSFYVFFNNCHMGKAALNARDMERLLFGARE